LFSFFFKLIDDLFSGALYVKAVFGEKDRQQANELIRNIREMFDANLLKFMYRFNIIQNYEYTR